MGDEFAFALRFFAFPLHRYLLATSFSRSL